ncbi:MAG: hypothetical protein COB33_011490 [Thiotrichaceae bacterium]|nr:hypothetical protein [Thiotrichaceae bacterium]PCI14300.1 MAG: hypothetical protein COB71_02945 [Thiotrichales bacterium]
MTSLISEIESLRNAIGQRVRFHNVMFEIIEILEDGPSFVLQNCEEHTSIQPDQHGEAHRRVPQTMTLPILMTSDGTLDSDGMGIELLA